jgi:uncharacterized membrane protein SirB2
MSISFYVWLHIISIIGWVSSGTHYLLSENPNKWAKILFGICSLTLLTAGFGLIARMGFSMHSSWIAAKLGIWLLLSALVPIIAKRKPEKKSLLYKVFILAIVTAVSIAIYHN